MGNAFNGNLTILERTINELRYSGSQIHERMHPVLGPVLSLYQRDDFRKSSLCKTLSAQDLDEYWLRITGFNKSLTCFFLLPHSMEVSNVEKLCGQFSVNKLYYDNYSVTLHKEFQVRQQLKAPFLDFELWVIALVVLGSFQDALQLGIPLPRYSLQNILFNEEGIPKVTCVYSHPECPECSQTQAAVTQAYQVLSTVHSFSNSSEDFNDMLDHLSNQMSDRAILKFSCILKRQKEAILDRKPFKLEGHKPLLEEASFQKSMSSRTSLGYNDEGTLLSRMDRLAEQLDYQLKRAQTNTQSKY